MANFLNNEGVKKSNDLQESAKKVVAKTNERVFEHLLIDGEEPTRKLVPVSDNFTEVVRDGCYNRHQTIAVEVFTDACWAHKREVAEMLMNDITFFSRAVYVNDYLHLIWVVQKTNNLPAMHFKIAIYDYLEEHYGLRCDIASLCAKEYDYSEYFEPWSTRHSEPSPIRHFQPITHMQYFTYEVGEQNAHAHSVFPDNQNEGKNNVSN